MKTIPEQVTVQNANHIYKSLGARQTFKLWDLC